MSHTTLQTGPPFQDAIVARLRLAVIASVLLNIVIWNGAAAVAKHPPAYISKPVEITRVILNPKGKPIEKKITPKQIVKHVAQPRNVIQRPKPPERRPMPQPRAERRPIKPIQVAKRLPEGAHTRVITAKLTPNTPPLKAEDHSALAGGNAPQGKVIEQQDPGNAVVNPPGPVARTPDPAPVVKAPEPAPAVKVPDPAPVARTPDPTPAAKAPEPKPEPRRKGPTKEAEPTDEIKPEIPDDLKQQGSYKSFVRVKVVVAADGSATPVLRTSSGNADIDNRVLEALKRWKWKPALKEGVPVESTQLFKFEFEVQ